MDSSVSSNFCSRCGSKLRSGDSFCSQCGSAVGDESNDDDDFRRRVEDLTVEGWEVKHDYGDRVVMIERGFGSWTVHALLLMFTGGLGNVPYAWYNYSPGADRLEVRADGTERYISGGKSDDDSTRSHVRTAGMLFASFVFALSGLAVFSDGASSLPVFFVGVTFLALALFAFPPMYDRIRDRESVTKFGRVRSTDERVVHAPDVPCAACARPVGTGVERTFHERFFVAGVPIVTDEKGSNCYCRSCANADPFTGRRLDETDRETIRE